MVLNQGWLNYPSSFCDALIILRKEMKLFLSELMNSFFPFLICSQVDKDHLRLAAALAVLRVSKSYDTQVPPQLFYSTVQCARVSEHLYFICYNS